MSSGKRRTTALIMLFLVSVIGVGNLVIGALSLLTINSMNLPDRLSALSSVVDSLDPRLIGAEHGVLEGQVSNLKTAFVEEMAFLLDYSQYLNLIPVYLVLNGIALVAVSLAIYSAILEKE